MGNKPSIAVSKPTSVSNSVVIPKTKIITEKEIMYKVTEECKKSIEYNRELEERIRKLNINVVNCDRDKEKMEIDVYKINRNYNKFRSDNDIENKKKEVLINDLKKKDKDNENEIINLGNQIVERDNQIKTLNEKLSLNDCQRNEMLSLRIKEINADLKKCVSEKKDLASKTENSIAAMKKCNEVQYDIQSENNNTNKLLSQYKNDVQFKDYRISSTDRHLSMWRTLSLVLLFLFILFLILYIFKKGTCDIDDIKSNILNNNSNPKIKNDIK